jgi:hypothetical protein
MFKVQASGYFTIRCLGQMFEIITLLHLLLLNITISLYYYITITSYIIIINGEVKKFNVIDTWMKSTRPPWQQPSTSQVGSVVAHSTLVKKIIKNEYD